MMGSSMVDTHGMQVHAKASANLAAGRIVSSHVASCEGWYSSGAASWSPCVDGNSSRWDLEVPVAQLSACSDLLIALWPIRHHE